MTDTTELFTLDAATRAQLLEASTATVSIQLLKRGYRFASVDGVRPLNRAAARFAGPAYTLRFIPAREDLATPASGARPDNPARVAIEEVPAGAVLVIDARGDRRAGTLGDILAARLLQRGVAGVVSDGAMRDAPELEKMALPIFCAGTAPPPSFNFLHPVGRNQPVGCGGAAVFPGDIVVGDGDGVVVVPRHLAAEVAQDSVERERLEAFIRRRIDSGQPVPATTRRARRRGRPIGAGWRPGAPTGCS